VGHRTALPAKNPMLADLGVLSIIVCISDNKLIIYRFKRYFCGLSLCKEKGARSFEGENCPSANKESLSEIRFTRCFINFR